MSIIEEIYHGQYQPQAGRPNLSLIHISEPTRL